MLVTSCGSKKKIARLDTPESRKIDLALAQEQANLPEVGEGQKVSRDTLKIEGENGEQLIIMKAIKDEESGEMVATEVLDAAKVTSRFRNIAERKGKVDLAFKVTIPKEFMDTKWQLILNPDMYIMEDSIRLDAIRITGTSYRKSQLRGYELYERFLSKIVADSTIYINVEQLEIFLERNIPEIYAFKSDTSVVTEQQFASVYGVSQKEAIDHYTDRMKKRINERRKARIGKMYKKYVKAPIVNDGIRLDSIVTDINGDIEYHYVQTINTRPKLRKVDVVLSGEILEEGKRIYQVPRSEPLTFYISSVSAFVENKEMFMKEVVYRRQTANADARIEFQVGKADVMPELGTNMQEILYIKQNLANLAQNEKFDLDSIVVSATASPDGSLRLNSALSQKRSDAVSKYFNSYIKEYEDSLKAEAGFSVSTDTSFVQQEKKKMNINFISRCIPENWDDLELYVEKDDSLSDDFKKDFKKLYKIDDLDKRERKLKEEPYYGYVKDSLFPLLRTVKFNFYLHRRGMVKDTIQTTVPDTTYANGLQCLRDMDYAGALFRLRPYEDINTAVAYVGLDRNINARGILTKLERTAPVNYLLAIVYSRLGDLEKAVECYLTSVRQNPSYKFRGNLDPEISVLIKMYGLNQEEEEPLEY